MDASLGTKIVGPGDGPVERYLGSTNYKIWGTTTDSVAVVTCANLPADWNTTFKTIDQNPGVVINSISEMVPKIEAINLRNNSQLRILFYKPTFSKFRGYRIYYRPVVEGPTQPYRVFETGFLPTAVTPEEWSTLTGGNTFTEGKFNGYDMIDTTLSFQFDPEKYRLGYVDLVITALYNTPSGIVEADYALASRVSAVLFVSSISTFNLYDSMAFSLKDTKTVTEELRTTWPAAPVINPKAWIKRTVVKNTNNYGREIEKFNNQYYINQYYRLRFQMPATSTGIVVYRRWFTPQDVTINPGFAGYLRGVGPWERIRLATGSIPLDGEGWYQLNLRPAIYPDYFNGNSVNPLYGPSGSWPLATDPRKLTGIYPILGAGAGITQGKEFTWQQFLFVIETSNVEQTNGLLLKSFKTAEDDLYNTSPLVPEVDGFTTGVVPRDLVVDNTAVYNTFDSATNRRLSQAITRPDNDKITRSTNNSASDAPFGPFPPARTAYGSAFTLRLQGPREIGITVY